jgi:hypothetical protein
VIGRVGTEPCKPCPPPCLNQPWGGGGSFVPDILLDTTTDQLPPGQIVTLGASLGPERAQRISTWCRLSPRTVATTSLITFRRAGDASAFASPAWTVTMAMSPQPPRLYAGYQVEPGTRERLGQGGLDGPGNVHSRHVSATVAGCASLV